MLTSEGTDSLRTRTGRLVLPVSASLLFHCLIFFVVMAGGLLQQKPPAEPIEIELVPPEKRVARTANPPPAPEPVPIPEPAQEAPPVPETQIVAPPDGPEEEPDEARFLSDRSTRAREETVKRGQDGTEDSAREEPGEGTDRTLVKPAPKPPKLTAHTTKPEPPPSKLPELKSLFARPSEMLKQPGFSKQVEEPKPRPSEYAALTNPGLWGPPGETGTQDYLPQIREGKFTLLNAKADLYAPFVRRVGMRVFQLFSRSFRREIASGSVSQGKENIEVEAVMSLDGRRIKVILHSRDGNLASDRVLLATLNDRIFFDENPPAKAAAEDGNIHFVFSLESSVWHERDRQTGRHAPGARWVFGAGLL